MKDDGIDLKRLKRGFALQKRRDLSRVVVHVEERLPEPLKGVTFTSIIRAVGAHYGVSVADIKGKSRIQHYLFPRYVVIWLSAKMLPNRSRAWVARQLNRDHSTGLNALRRVEEMIKDELFAGTINAIEHSLRSGHFDDHDPITIPGQRESRLFEQAWQREKSLSEQRAPSVAAGGGVEAAATEAA